MLRRTPSSSSPLAVSILGALDDAQLLGSQFGPEWRGDARRAFLASLFGCP
jgi:hypothetical protein